MCLDRMAGWLLSSLSVAISFLFFSWVFISLLILFSLFTFLDLMIWILQPFKTRPKVVDECAVKLVEEEPWERASQ